MLAVGECELGSTAAHAVNTVKTAGGFARLGAEVLLLTRPPRDGVAARDALASYGEQDRIRHTPFDGPARPDDWRLVPEWERMFAAWAVEQASAFAPDAVYTRSYVSPVRLARAGFGVVAETHAYVGAENPSLDELLRGVGPNGPVGAVTTIAPVLARHYASRGADPERLHVVPDGVDLELFGCEPHAFGDRPAVVYAGSLSTYKGVATAIEAISHFGDPGPTLHVFGGPPEEAERLARGVPSGASVRFHGVAAPARVPGFLRGADALVLPTSAREPSAEWTSPIKLAEYLAAGPPIVASGIPGVRRWAEEPAVAWHEPDDAASLARALRAVLAESEPARRRRVDAARALARRYCYPERARAMLAALSGAPLVDRLSHTRTEAVP